MSELVTVARPYAKAVFDFAAKNQTIIKWQLMLTFSSEVIRNEQMTKFLSSVIVPKKLADMFIAVCGDKLDSSGRNLIRVMAENNRLTALPEVLEQFIHLRAVQESTVEIKVISASPLNEKQLGKISFAMKRVLSRKVRIDCGLDESIMAGIIVRIGDMVIDGSVRGRLERLADILQS